MQTKRSKRLSGLQLEALFQRQTERLIESQLPGRKKKGERERVQERMEPTLAVLKGKIGGVFQIARAQDVSPGGLLFIPVLPPGNGLLSLDQQVDMARGSGKHYMPIQDNMVDPGGNVPAEPYFAIGISCPGVTEAGEEAGSRLTIWECAALCLHAFTHEAHPVVSCSKVEEFELYLRETNNQLEMDQVLPRRYEQEFGKNFRLPRCVARV